MSPLLLALIVFCAQLLVIVSVAAIAEALGRVTDPQVSLTYWRGIALACLALPLSAFFSPGPGANDSAVTYLLASVSMSAEAAAPGAVSAIRVIQAILPAATTLILPLYIIGALARLVWLCAGAVRLRQLRRRSRAVVVTTDLETIRASIAPRAEYHVSHEVSQPACFGLRRPIVLLPESFFAMNPEAQCTVACHELLHVARRDWAWIVVEDVARALFWFHPAIWWLVERIQESREQVVDRLVITRIPAKRAYMTALLEFADGGRPVVMATAFLRKRHLRSRLRKLAKEPVMSRARLISTAVVLVSVMGGAVVTTVRALPLGTPIGTSIGTSNAQNASPADQEKQEQVVSGKDPGVTMPRVVSEVRPQYTPEALKARIQGTAILDVVVRTDGTPRDIEITQSLDTEYGLDKQAVAALSEWRFEPGRKDGKPVPVRVEITVQFTLRP